MSAGRRSLTSKIASAAVLTSSVSVDGAVSEPAATGGAGAAPSTSASTLPPKDLPRNLDPAFDAVALVRKHAAQVRTFEKWASSKDWRRFHSEHYDWWLVPVDTPSSHGWAWTVLPGDVASLRSDARFMAAYRHGVELLFRAWGWHLTESRPLTLAEIDDAAAQTWQNWPIRLFKAASSLLLFEEHALAASALRYGRTVIAASPKGAASFKYAGRDLAPLFLHPPTAL